eukprot:557459_1
MTHQSFLLNQQSCTIWLFVLWGLNVLVFTPYIAFNTYLFYKQRTDPFITKRRPLLVVILIGIILFTLDIARPLMSLIEIYPFVHLDESHFLWGRSIVFLISTFLFCRAWKIFFDFQAAEHLLDLKWMQIIRSHQLYVPWTIKHKITGDPRLLVLVSFVLYTILLITTVLLTIYTSNPLYVTITLCGVLGMLLLLFIYPLVSILKLGHDFYQIHKELQYLSVISLIIFILFAVDVMPNSIVNVDSLLMYTLISATFIWLSLLQTKWVLHKQHKFLNHVSERKAHGSIALGHIDEIHTSPNDENNIESGLPTTEIPMKLTLEDILKTETGFKAFAHHLVRELTVEHLLYIVECIQLKHEMLRYDLLNDDQVGWMIELPSQIIEYGETYLDNAHAEDEDDMMDVNDDDDEDVDLVSTPRTPVAGDDDEEQKGKQFMTVFTFTDVIENFDYLCNYYITVDAEHSLNLSSRVRKKLVTLTTECKTEFEKLDQLHKMTQTRVSSWNVGLLTPSAPRTASPRSLTKGLSILSFRSLRNVNVNVADTEHDIGYDEVPTGVDTLKVWTQVNTPTMRFAQLSDIAITELNVFASTPCTPMPTEADHDILNIIPMIDCDNRSKNTIHYNKKNKNVSKMKEMVVNLVDQLDKSLYEVYRLIEHDSYKRFMETHQFIALEKRAYKRVKKNSTHLSQSLNINLAALFKP